MRLLVGTSGYSYKEWKGTFYPTDLPAAKMLSFYAGHFGAVEINNTFYRMPRAKMLETWASEVPDDFTFVLKAPRWILYQHIHDFVDLAAESLGPKFGPMLFELAPAFQKDPDKLRDFLGRLPRERRAAFNVKEDTGLGRDEIYAILRDHDVALCISDTDDVADPDQIMIPTASWGYVRLRRADYSDKQLAGWKRRIKAQRWSDAYVFFKHEDEGKGPAFAKRFLR